MATAEEFINTALRKIGVKSSEVPLKTSELNEALELLNDMGAQLEADGFELGYTELAAIGDTVTIPAYANNFYKTALGARLAAEYSVDITQTLAADVQSSKEAVIRALNRKVVGVTGSYQDLIYSAMELLGVKAGAEPITLSEINNALPRLNDLMVELESMGFNFGYIMSSGDDLASESGLPDFTLSWIKSTLAIRLATSYGMNVSQELIRMNTEAQSAIYKRSADLPQVVFSDTMPVGSGNSVSGWSWDNFYRHGQNGGLSDGRDRPITDDIGVMLNDGDLP